MNRQTHRGDRVRRAVHGIAATVLVLAVAACDELLDVENPNQLTQDDVEDPATAPALVSGALATVARGYSFLVLRHDAAADELQFIGSRDAWVQLIRGDLRDPNNEFADAAWPFIAEGRWMADETIRQLTILRDNGELSDPVLLAQAELFSAIIYTAIADVFEDYVFSDRREDGPPFGPENMFQLYEMAIEKLDVALPIAQAAGDQELETAILAQRARSRHALEVWRKINPPGEISPQPLVATAEIVADARAAVARMPDPDWSLEFAYSGETITNNWGAWVNERAEMRISDAYANADRDVTLEDPIDGIPDPALARRIAQVTGVRGFGPMTVVSARELHLILAEASLAEGDEGGFTQHINDLRALDDPLTPYSGQIDALELLIHSRRVNLLTHTRKLSDNYRFGTPSFLWASSSTAVQRPGTKFPITQIELTSNCFILGTCSS